MGYLLTRADVRRPLPFADGTFHCVVTSPPYWGLRDYGTGKWVGGDPDCDHKASNARPDHSNGVMLGTRGVNGSTAATATPYAGECGRCGARRVDAQIGLEATPEAFIAAMVGVFREVWRILRNDGTLWLNMGDSYARSGGEGGCGPNAQVGNTKALVQRRMLKPPSGLKPKDLLLMPARLAIALQADGWYVRQECIWSKRNCMPESVRDRPTRSHEMVYLLTKSPRYFYDDIATRCRQKTAGRRHEGASGYREGHPSKGGIKSRALNPLGSAERSVWSLSSNSYKGAHFATMPVSLAAKCILLGTSEKGCCPACGSPWRRVVERHRQRTRPGVDSKVNGSDLNAITGRSGNITGYRDTGRHVTSVRVLGWESSCTCIEPEPVPCRVFDPFGGAGTTPKVADVLGRHGFATELSGEYLELARARMIATTSVMPKVRPTKGQAAFTFADRESP